jgi:hypothetical protein
MDEEHAARFRAVLENLRDELRASLDSNDDATSPVSPDRAIGRLTRQDASGLRFSYANGRSVKRAGE